MAQLTDEQRRMVDEALKNIGPYGRVQIVVDSDSVSDIEGRKTFKLLKGGKPVLKHIKD